MRTGGEEHSEKPEEEFSSEGDFSIERALISLRFWARGTVSFCGKLTGLSNQALLSLGWVELVSR